MMLKSYKVAANSTRGPTIEDLRAAVAKAEADGVSRDTMLLRLTFRDESLIKRSPEVGLDEVSFIDGEMRFVGVRVKVGNIPSACWTLTRSPIPSRNPRP
uniref:Uncharacterized protein n=1 Tax=Phenylobacterium glaciei TaxID=2803784 RepID=A0A974S7A0_9CAUL|nr:hypothetical protein JKL49_16320 [Phenylobacterium glaciei]